MSKSYYQNALEDSEQRKELFLRRYLQADWSTPRKSMVRYGGKRSGVSLRAGRRIGKTGRYSRRVTRGRRRTFKARPRYRKTYRKRRGSFKRRVQAVVNQDMPWKVKCYRTSQKILGALGSTILTGYDVGLGGASSGTYNAPGFPSTTPGDLYQYFNGSWTLAGYGQNIVSVDFNTLFLTLRNQCNFGCFLKVYYAKTPISNMTTGEYSINDLLTAEGFKTTAIDWTQNNDLTDIPGISKFMKITNRRVYQFMPGETKSFKLSMPKVRTQNFARICFRVRNYLTRTIIFQITGFPLHDQTTTSNIQTSNISIDVVSEWRIRGRVHNTTVNALSSSSSHGAITTAVGEQWQKGSAAEPVAY